MSTCGCTDTNPATPLPPNCNAIPAYEEPTVPDAVCCMACVFDDMEANWVKPVGEATAILPVCDATRFREDQCVAVIGTNGLGGVYKVDAVLSDSIQVVIHGGTTYDIGGAGTVQGGRLYLLPVCPLSQESLIELIGEAIPSEFTLAVHSSSDTTHGFSLAVDSGKIKLVYSQVNFEAQIATYLNTLGVTLFKPVTNIVKLDLFNMPNPDPLANTTGTIDVAADFGVVVPANATHVRLRVHFEVMAGNSVGAVAGDESHIVANLGFNGSSQFAIEQYSQNVTPAVNSTEGFALRNASWTHINMDLPLTAGQVTWSFTHTLYPTTGKAAAGNDADAYVRLLGFLITP
jgi:hypothetical protein